MPLTSDSSVPANGLERIEPVAKRPKRFTWRVMIVALATVALVSVVTVWLWLRSFAAPISWSSDALVFERGSIGTEFAPRVAFEVLPELFPEYFLPGGAAAGEWDEQFGFSRSENGLPFGFAVSHLQPLSGDGSPVEFVGLACAACHTNVLRTDTGVHRIVGGGGASVDIIGFSEALRATILDQRLTVAAISDQQKRKRGYGLTTLERFVVARWIGGFRDTATSEAAKYDEPFPHRLHDPRVYPAGPGRTRAFRSLVRVVLDRPGEQNWAITKIPALYSQGLRKFAQFDGSIEDHDARSALAALTAGATPQSLASRQIAPNVRATTRFTNDLPAPRWSDYTAAPVDRAAAARGRTVYEHSCLGCHGGPGASGWEMPTRPVEREVTPVGDIGTDDARLTFPHAEEMVGAINSFLGAGHPFQPGPKIRLSAGYSNGPIDGAFTRAPYLHNGSVLTLAELLNLEPRRDVFFRGANRFDPDRVGLLSPTEAQWLADTALQRALPFRFSTAPGHPGNSCAGHDYPWTRSEVEADEAKKAQLRDLLEYLKTL
jgi:hypothetical protein